MLPILLLLWWIAASALLFLMHCYIVWDHPSAYRLSLGDFFRPEALIITGLSSLLLSGLQFGLWKSQLWQRKRRAIQIGAAIFSALAITIAMVFSVRQRQLNYRWAARGIYSMNEYEALAQAGKYDELVESMEKDCAYFNYAKQKMGGDLNYRSYNLGFGYIHSFMQVPWESNSRLAPTSVMAILEDTRHYESRHNTRPNGAYGPWRPIANRIRQSNTPVLRAMAAFMLDDKDGYASAAYELADQDPDAKFMAASASLTDPDRIRAIERIEQYLADGTFSSFTKTHETILEKAYNRLGQLKLKAK